MPMLLPERRVPDRKERGPDGFTAPEYGGAPSGSAGAYWSARSGGHWMAGAIARSELCCPSL